MQLNNEKRMFSILGILLFIPSYVLAQWPLIYPNNWNNWNNNNFNRWNRFNNFRPNWQTPSYGNFYNYNIPRQTFFYTYRGNNPYWRPTFFYNQPTFTYQNPFIFRTYENRIPNGMQLGQIYQRRLPIGNEHGSSSVIQRELIPVSKPPPLIRNNEQNSLLPIERTTVASIRSTSPSHLDISVDRNEPRVVATNIRTSNDRAESDSLPVNDSVEEKSVLDINSEFNKESGEGEQKNASSEQLDGEGEQVANTNDERNRESQGSHENQPSLVTSTDSPDIEDMKIGLRDIGFSNRRA